LKKEKFLAVFKSVNYYFPGACAFCRPGLDAARLALAPADHLRHGGSGCRPSLLAARVPQVRNIGRLYTITHAHWHLRIISAMVAVGAVLLFWLPESPRSEI
jgi:hypothetical protein